jgi:hypothetical protein
MPNRPVALAKYAHAAPNLIAYRMLAIGAFATGQPVFAAVR